MQSETHESPNCFGRAYVSSVNEIFDLVPRCVIGGVCPSFDRGKSCFVPTLVYVFIQIAGSIDAADYFHIYMALESKHGFAVFCTVRRGVGAEWKETNFG